MEAEKVTAIANNIIAGVEKLIPCYMENEEDLAKANGNVAICLIDENGQIYGKIFGTDKIRGREAYRVAWLKASQVWITGVKTGEYEKLVFSGEIEEEQYGIRKPDYIGWDGGQPLVLEDGTKISAGFSGFRGVTDLEIVVKALEFACAPNRNNQLINNYQTI